MNPLTRFWRRAQARMEGRRNTVYTVSHDQRGLDLAWLTLEGERGAASLQWAEVQRVIAYKRDLYVVDLICIRVELVGARAVEVDEEMPGWQDLIESLPTYLPGCAPPSAWLLLVAVPAFEPNETTLYNRSSAAA